MEQFDPARPDALPHAGTFNNNTLTMTVGHAAITEIFTPEACVALNGGASTARLNDLFMGHQAALQATGLGSMMTLHPVGGSRRGTRGRRECRQALERHLYLDLLEEGFISPGAAS